MEGQTSVLRPLADKQLLPAGLLMTLGAPSKQPPVEESQAFVFLSHLSTSAAEPALIYRGSRWFDCWMREHGHLMDLQIPGGANTSVWQKAEKIISSGEFLKAGD